MIFFIIFFIIPLIEIALFISVGGAIGVVKTLLLCLLTAGIGAVLIRQQGLQTLFSARKAMNRGDIPLNEFFDGICLAVAGALLMTPGFFTDAIGFSLLVPPVRTWLRHYLAARFDVTDAGMPGADFTARRDTTIIEAEYERLDEQDKP